MRTVVMLLAVLLGLIFPAVAAYTNRRVWPLFNRFVFLFSFLLMQMSGELILMWQHSRPVIRYYALPFVVLRLGQIIELLVKTWRHRSQVRWKPLAVLLGASLGLWVVILIHLISRMVKSPGILPS